jgi:O-antigen/teichoic acid export membrane protein
MTRSRLILNDSVALIVASLSAVVAGAVRLKLSAEWFGPEATAVVSQLTQLYVVIFTFATLGLSTGIRVALARIPDPARRQELAWRVVVIPVFAACVLVVSAQPLAGVLAGRFLDDVEQASGIRIALLAAIPAVASQALSAVVQAEAKFKQLAVANIASAALGSLAITAAASRGDLLLLIWTIPLLPLIQLASILTVSPHARNVLRAWAVPSFEGLGEVLHIGAFSFVLAGAASLAETIIRAALVSNGGLALIATLQPTYLVTNQLFTLVLGATSSALMVHTARSLATDPGVDAQALHATALRFVAVITFLALAVQAALVLITTALLSDSFLPGVRTARFAIACEPLNAVAWAYGACLLPLGRARVWLFVGLLTVATQTVAAIAFMPGLGASAIPLSYSLGWTASALATAGILASLRLSPSAMVWALAIGGSACLAVTAKLAGTTTLAWEPLLAALLVLTVGIVLMKRDQITPRLWT